MHVPPGRRFAAAILGAAVVVACCAGGSSPSGVASPAPVSVGPSSPSSSAPVTATPTVQVEPTGRASPAGTEPPAASLSAEGGEPVTGQLGSFTWRGGGSDSPWLPGSAIRVGAGEPLTVVLAADPGIADWSARRVSTGTTDGSGAVGLGSGMAPIAFVAPGVGTWSVQVVVHFAGGQDDAAYYWAIEAR